MKAVVKSADYAQAVRGQKVAVATTNGKALDSVSADERVVRRILDYLRYNAWEGNLVQMGVFFQERFGSDGEVHEAISYLGVRQDIRICGGIGIALMQPVPKPAAELLKRVAANGGLLH